MNMHINDVCALKELLTRVVRKDYDLIDERVANALLELATEEYDAFMDRLEQQAAIEEARAEAVMAQYD